MTASFALSKVFGVCSLGGGEGINDAGLLTCTGLRYSELAAEYMRWPGCKVELLD